MTKHKLMEIALAAFIGIVLATNLFYWWSS